MPLLNRLTENDTDNPALSQNIEEIEREAYKRGFEAGENAGFGMGEQKALVLIEKLEAILEDMTTLREKQLLELEPQIVELATGIARKIIMKELTTNPDEIVEITKKAMMKLERTGRITIKINPSLYDLFIKHKPEILSIHDDIVFDMDPAISRNSSVLTGPMEDIVTDIDEQIKNLMDETREKIGGN